MVLLEFYYGATGILLWCYWNFIMVLLEFYYGAKLKKARKIGDFFWGRNQDGNQEA